MPRKVDEVSAGNAHRFSALRTGILIHPLIAMGPCRSMVPVGKGTGHVAPLDNVAVEDVGRIVNPPRCTARRSAGSCRAGRVLHGKPRLRRQRAIADRHLGRLHDPDRNRFPDNPCLRAREPSVSEQSAWGEGCRRGHDHPGRRPDGECHRQRTCFVWRKAGGSATDVSAGVAHGGSGRSSIIGPCSTAASAPASACATRGPVPDRPARRSDTILVPR